MRKMEKSETWRTLHPQKQEELISTPNKRAFDNKWHQSQIGDMFGGEKTQVETQSRTPIKTPKTNLISKENPLSNSMYLPKPEKLKKPNKNNFVSTENPLNYSFQPAKSERIIKTHVTKSKISCLPGSVDEPLPPRHIKTVNSQSYLDFLPGSYYPKKLPEKKPMAMPRNITNKCTEFDDPKVSMKKLRANKLHNHFSISEQYDI
ncbi:hypothetical protein SteCoe_20656 [Stentor coeruleus]|uniref:Uncharacterized protein n=1 Tax=Stentor coeruleus TaxID=5963 RepID=A0A1R2BRB0_9CILI|nr:hypothetical protein SteCoe_20656 [Stentor coeruleus]